MPNSTENALKRATKGLLYPSESDEPFRTFRWDDVVGPLTAEKVLKLAEQKSGTPVRELSLEDFFGELTEQDDEDDAKKYRNLRKVVEDQLRDVKVFQVGEVNIDIYVVGKTKDGHYAGIKTTSVET